MGTRRNRTTGRRAALAAALVLVGLPLVAGAAGPAPTGVTVVPVTSVDGRPVVALHINQQGPFRFYVDTGSDLNIIRPAVVRALGLVKKGKRTVHGPVGSKQAEVDLIPVASVDAGAVPLGALTFVALEAARSQEIDGVLGVFNLPPGLVVLDLAAGNIRIEPGTLTAGDRDVLPFERSPVMSIKGEVDGRPADFHVDASSSDGVTIPAAMAGELHFSSDLVVTRERGPLVVKTATLRGKVRIGRLVLKDPEVHVAELYRDFGTLGSAFLARHVVTIDREHSLLRITAAKGAGKK